MQEIPKTYTASDWEDKLYKLWEESGYFNPDKLLEDKIVSEESPTFSVLMPPPNVTGVLHLGHAMENALMDSMTRYKRMQGFKTLFLPGADHAAIATQARVEKNLAAEGYNNPRQELGREKLLEKIREYADDSKETIIKQVRKVGSSCDWSRFVYTFDEKRGKAVNTVFKKMYDDGIIYRGDRIVNWDPNMQTTVSDDEIEHKEESSQFYYLQYGPFVIGTARPETKFGDKYVVMHPDDERYSEYKDGQTIELEWINGPITATIIKDAAIDMGFGTGVMTITPWHDATDFDIAERHNLSKEQVIDFNGKLLSIAQEFTGMDIRDARKKIVEKLESKGLVVKIEDGYVHNIATNSRGGGIIEPQIKQQWFIDVNKTFSRNGKEVSLKSLMQNAVRSGDVKINPERFTKIYFHWIDNLRDWCISRQIWWGHRIPVWYRNEEIYCGVEAPKGDGWEQDPDTLDTWFSSGLWSFSTLGWPEKTIDLERFHPISWMQMGYEILFPWMARMILMTTYTLQTIPFENVYIHGILRDKNGQKFSKSLGNGIDPLDVISQYGTDAMRISLLSDVAPGNDARFYYEKVEANRNLVNKLWNISRYILTSITENKNEDTPLPRTAADTWILSRLQETINDATQHLNTYNFSLAIESLRTFTWNDFADWYIEIHKIEKNDTILSYILNTLLKLWHPFAPFVTEAIYQIQNESPTKPLMITSWPKMLNEEYADTSFKSIISLITQIRNIRSTYKIDPVRKVDITIVTNDTDFIQNQVAIMQRLARVENVNIIAQDKDINNAAYAIIGNIKLYVHLESILDIEKEKTRLQRELEQTKVYIQRLESQLANKDFAEKAPQAVIERNKAELEKAHLKLSETEQYISTLS